VDCFEHSLAATGDSRSWRRGATSKP
jgi:hypothetical protein